MCKVLNARIVGKAPAPGRVYIGRASKWGKSLRHRPRWFTRGGHREISGVARVATRVARRARRTPRPRSGLLVRAAVVPRRRADRAREPGLTSSAPSRRRGRFCMPSAKLGSIAAAPLGAQQLQEQPDGFPLLVEGVLNHPSARPDPSPTADQACLTEQCLIDRHGVEPGHVPTRVHAFDIEAIALRNHANKIAQAESAVQ